MTDRRATPNPAPVVRREVAHSLDTPSALAPYLERLFAPLPSLGAMPGRSVTVLGGELTPGPRTRVLDAGCGKGAVSVMLARRLGCRVHGFDAMPAFVQEAAARALRAGVAGRCRFEARAAEEFFRGRAGPFDAAMMLNLWPAPRALAALRRVVRPGGLILIDDATRDPRRVLPRGIAPMRTLEEMNRALTRRGDEIIRVVRPAPSAVAAQNRSLYRRIQRSAGALAADHPGLRPHLRELMRRQRNANRLLTTCLRPTMWLMRRGD